ncbi:AAA family ATPase [Oscillatoria laete-virens NRMC-F 0139]|nr:AAA family ATPase [Oscillatoria laete-virens]MDL5054727.1 AAA family ATPase [Oscillatoria laete-virens NRMC-F 0139]
MAKKPTSSKSPSPAPALVGREGELERLRVLLNASGAFVPVILGRSGTGKTALLRAMAAQFAPTKVTVMNAANCVESLASLSKSKWLPVDNLHRLTLEQVIRLLDWLDQWRIGKNNRAVLTHDTDIGAEEFAALLQKYPFVKPIHLAPLSQTATAHVLEQFAAARGVVAPPRGHHAAGVHCGGFFPGPRPAGLGGGRF